MVKLPIFWHVRWKHDREINMDSRISSIALLKKALRNDPKNSIYLSKIVEHLIQEGKFDEAGAWIESFRGTSDDPLFNTNCEYLLSSGQ